MESEGQLPRTAAPSVGVELNREMDEQSNRLKGKVAFVTGAGSGIGEATARALADRGVKLGLASLEGDDLGLDAVAEVCDVRDFDAVQSLVDRTVSTFGRLDIVFANAGIGIIRRRFEDHSLEEIERVIDVNVKGLMHTVRACLPHLRRSEEPDLVTLVSQSGVRVIPLESVYCATKFAQYGFTRALDRELNREGIRTTAICPGGVATRFGFDGAGREPGADELDQMLQPADVAEAVLYVLTRPHSYRIVEVGLLPRIEEF
jgi:NADP-dependent 3-hydroxy acid dehydrogenase YdfG